VQLDHLIYQRSGQRALLTLNRPDRRNALSAGLVDDLHTALEAAKRDDMVRVVVLTGAGDKAFCAGGDLAGGMVADGLAAGHAQRGRFAELFPRMRDLGKPIVARVNGDALGGGLGLVAACDLAVATDRARFGTPEIQLGLFPFVILATLTRNLPRKHALELFFTGEKVDASRARDMGLLNRVVPPADLDAAVDTLCAQVERHSPLILKLGRDAIAAASEMGYDAALRYLNTMLTLNTLTEDAMEGIAAFFGKREPEWKGR
jgi:enoyl-CoA hydratase/carnithine racemase